MAETYHHGDLPRLLIQKGIAYVNTYGVATLSLRKLSAQCDVSYTAVYAHFKNKESLLLTMRHYVEDEFVACLSDCIRDINEKCDRVLQLGIAYVAFFVQNPHYFHFIYSDKRISISFDTVQEQSTYVPYEIFRKAALCALESQGILTEEAMRQNVIAMWSIVHGIASLAVMNTISFGGDWCQLTSDILIKNITMGR